MKREEAALRKELADKALAQQELEKMGVSFPDMPKAENC
jgi:hypothetical protein